jgi:hypothetical protein
MLSHTRSHLHLTLLLVALLIPGSLWAQTVPSPFRFVETRQEAGIFLGQQNAGSGRFGYGPSGGLVLGARYGIRLGGAFALEGNVGSISATRDLVDPTRVEGDRVVGEVDSRILTLDARLRFTLIGDRTWHGIAPFFVVGGGGAFETSGGGPDEDLLLLPEDQFNFTSTFTGILGTGVRWFVGKRFILRGDLDLMMWRIKAPPGFRDPERELTGVEEKEWVSGPLFTIGSSIRF